MLVSSRLTAKSELVVITDFALLINGFNPLTVPYVAEVPLLAGVGQKGRSEHGNTFAVCPTEAVIGDPVRPGRAMARSW